jgi:hypothetical protein
MGDEVSVTDASVEDIEFLGGNSITFRATVSLSHTAISRGGSATGKRPDGYWHWQKNADNGRWQGPARGASESAPEKFGKKMGDRSGGMKNFGSAPNRNFKKRNS